MIATKTLAHASSICALAGLFGPNAFPIPEQYFRNFYLNDSSFDISSLNTDLINAATEANVGQLISVNPDIREFVNRGGKLLQYHGLADQLISCKTLFRDRRSF